MEISCHTKAWKIWKTLDFSAKQVKKIAEKNMGEIRRMVEVR